MIWQELKTPAVRDLAWACFSPPLLHSMALGNVADHLENCHLKLTRQRSDRLRHLDGDPAPLLTHLAARKHARLGIYFESLWQFFLDTDPDTELLAHNLAIREGAKTLGEFDLLYLCRQTRRHIHLELAVKLYLGLPGSNIWLGPGQRDQLEFKLAHMAGRQIQLGAVPQAQAALRRLGIEKLCRQIEVKGYLFRPPSDDAALPPAYNYAVPLSNWYHIDEFRQLGSSGSGRPGWQRVERGRWLAPLLQPVADQVPGHANLLAQLGDSFRSGAGPQLLACCDQRGRELQRCFVTPRCWPAAEAEVH